jgi:DNA-binding LacI/PurR family transcriptional regulator
MRGIRQLAHDLDISIGTVSRALNGKPEVNEATRKRVLEAAARLGYVANQSGRSLRQGNSSAVGFVIESGGRAAENNDNFFMGVFDGVQSVLSQHRLDLIVLPCSTNDDPVEFLRRIVARQSVDGIIISETQRIDPRIELLSAAGMPFIALGRSQSGANCSWIDLDFEGVANQAVDRLVLMGHKRIAVAIPDNQINLGYVFRDAYRSALARHGLASDPELILKARLSVEGGYQIAQRILALKTRPTAILLVYELMALGLYRRLGEAGLSPGRDIAVIGFREGAQSSFLSPALTCFRLSLHALGVALARSLLATMPAYRAHFPSEPRRRLWPLELVPGESDGRTR